jgi:hypothetical protein
LNKKLESRLNSENAGYRSLHRLLSCSLLRKRNVKIKIYKYIHIQNDARIPETFVNMIKRNSFNSSHSNFALLCTISWKSHWWSPEAECFVTTVCQQLINLICIVGVESKLGPLGTSAIYWPTVSAPGDCEDGEFRGMKWQGKPKYSEKTCRGATLSTTNPTWPDPSSNPGRRVGKPVTNRLSYGAANVSAV